MKGGTGGYVDELTDCTLMLNTVVAHCLLKNLQNNSIKLLQD